MIKLIYLFFVILTSSLYPSIQQYFKKIEDKQNFQEGQIRNIDFIYLINLDQRPEKYGHCLNELSPYGIYPYRFSAVNGWELSLEILNDVGVKYTTNMPKDILANCYLPNENFEVRHETMHVVGRNYFTRHMAPGTVGIVLSHLSILQDAYDSGYETIWVLEDDIEVIQDPHLLSSKIEELDALIGCINWDVLFTDQDSKNQNGDYVRCTASARRPNFTPRNPNRFELREKISTSFSKIGARYGGYSMILRRSGIKKILDFIKTHQIFLPYDMDYILPNDIKLFSLNDDIVSTLKNALSDNGIAHYKEISR